MPTKDTEDTEDTEDNSAGLITALERIRDSVPEEAWYAFYRRNAELARDDLLKAFREMKGIPGADEVRLDIMSAIGDVVCDRCGRLQPDERYCQCWNDE